MKAVRSKLFRKLIEWGRVVKSLTLWFTLQGVFFGVDIVY